MRVISNFGFLISELVSLAGPWLSMVLPSAIRNPPSEITLAYRPFLDPAPIDRYWIWLLLPLILVIAFVYRTIKSESLVNLPRQGGFLAFQISVFMVLAAAALWLLLLFV